jgi:hypothetical protein
MKQRSARRPVRDAFGTACLLFFFVYFLAVGMHIVSDQHSGIAAQVNVDKCMSSGKSVHCAAIWRHAGAQDGSPVDESIRITGVSRDDIGRDVAVHIHYGRDDGLWLIIDDQRPYAVADSSWGGFYWLGVACFLGVCATVAIMRPRRHRESRLDGLSGR